MALLEEGPEQIQQQNYWGMTTSSTLQLTWLQINDSVLFSFLDDLNS